MPGASIARRWIQGAAWLRAMSSAARAGHEQRSTSEPSPFAKSATCAISILPLKSQIKHRVSRPPSPYRPFKLKVCFCVRGLVSPLLANVYLHYVFDLWVDVWRRKVAKGDVIVVRYADDLVMGFQQRADAMRFLDEFKEQLAKFSLELHPEKTRLIEFGRYAARDRTRRGEGKPETFNFLGFTHYCGQRHKTKTFTVWRITAKLRMIAKLKAIQAELRNRKHDRTSQVGSWLRKVVLGYYQYHAVPGNIDQLRTFRQRTNRLRRNVLVR